MNLAVNDDWGMAWDVRHLFPQRIYPSQSALALPQIYWAALVTHSSADYRLLRLSVIPFVLLTAIATYKSARLLDARPPWAAVAVMALLCNPLYLASATTFMTDMPFVGLLMGCAWAALSWLKTGRGMVACIVLAALATLQRQSGLTIPLAIAAAFVFMRGPTNLRRSEVAGLVALGGSVVCAYVLPHVLGVEPPTQSNRLEAILHLEPLYPLVVLVALPGMIGLVAMPFIWSLISRPVDGVVPKRDHRGPALFGLVLIQLAWAFASGFDIFPGDLFGPRGLHLSLPPGPKPYVYPPALIVVVELIAIATAGALLIWRWPDLRKALNTPAGVLLCLAAAQLLPILLVDYLVFDRYYLPVAAPLLPLAAALATRSACPPVASLTAVSLGLLGLAMFAVGEQDLQAILVARDAVARQAYSQASPLDVQAGYESNAVYGEVPYYERTGILLSSLSKAGPSGDFSTRGPEHPLLEVQFACSNDPRPGVSYRSVASGRLILVPGGTASARGCR
jgi:hypothetical protein